MFVADVKCGGGGRNPDDAKKFSPFPVTAERCLWLAWSVASFFVFIENRIFVNILRIEEQLRHDIARMTVKRSINSSMKTARRQTYKCV